jgi:hypothetical protein
MQLTALRIGAHHGVAPRPVVPGTPVLVADGGLTFSGVWDRVQLPYERVALCTPYGTFLSCQYSTDGRLRLTLAAELGPHEAFEEVLWPDGDVSLRPCERTFVAAPDAVGEPLRADGADGEPVTRFRYGVVPGPLAADVAQAKAGAPRVADMPRQFAQPVAESRE